MQDASSEQKKKNKKPKIQAKLLAERTTTSLSLANRRKNKETKKQKLSINLTLYEVLTNHWIKFRRAETERKKKFNLLQGKNSTFLETWEKETPKTIT